MRLIDADALPAALFRHHVHDGEELEPMLYYDDAIQIVNDAPTVDAIPVEWLRGIAVERFMNPVLDLLWYWQQEREAR